MSTTIEELKKSEKKTLEYAISKGTRVVFQRPSERTSSKLPRLGTVDSGANRGDKFVYVRFDSERDVQKRCSVDGVDLLKNVIAYATTDFPPTEEDWSLIGLTPAAIEEFCQNFKLPPAVGTLKDGELFEYKSMGGVLQRYLSRSFNYRSGYESGRKKPPEQTTRFVPSHDFRLRLTYPTLDIALANPDFAKGFEDGRRSLLENTSMEQEEASNSVPEPEEISESVMESEDPESIPQPVTTTQVNHSEQLSLLPTKRPVFTYLDVGLDALPPNTALASPEPSKAFIESVEALGVLQPILVVIPHLSTGEKYVQVLAGIRRIKAARAANFDQIPAMVLMNPDEVDYREVLTLVENHQRKDNPIADIRAIKELMLRGAGEKEICDATGLTKSQLKRFEPLLHLHEVLLRAMQSGAISPSVAIAAARRTRSEQEELAELYYENEKLNQKDVDEIRRVKRKAAFSYLPADMFEEEEPPTPPEPTWSEKMLFHLAAALGALVGVKPQSDAESNLIVSVGDRLQELIDDLNDKDHGEE